MRTNVIIKPIQKPQIPTAINKAIVIIIPMINTNIGHSAQRPLSMMSSFVLA